MKKTISNFYEMKEKGEKISLLVVYDCHMAQLTEQAGTDMLLAGDSVGMAVYGMKGTVPVTMDQMIAHSIEQCGEEHLTHTLLETCHLGLIRRQCLMQ